MPRSVVRQLVLRMQRRCGQFEALVARSVREQIDGAGHARNFISVLRLRELNRLNLHDCRRLVSATNAIAQEPSECEYVKEQLLESLRIHIRKMSAVHPWGSTSAVERLIEPELESETVTIAVETEDLPHSLDAVWHRGDISLALEFHLSHVVPLRSNLRKAVYHVALRSTSHAPKF